LKHILRLGLLITILFSAVFLQPPQAVQTTPRLLEALPPLITPPL